MISDEFPSPNPAAYQVLYTSLTTSQNMSFIDSPDASGLATPQLGYNGINFMPKSAIASFENLVALANHQERLREARKMVWRDKGQPVVELQNLRACLVHAGRGGLSTQSWLRLILTER
jgi:hypothetical protein